MNNIQVVVADDHPIVRRGIYAALQAESDIEVIAEADDGFQALQLAKTLHPDVLVLDVQMPKMDGVAVARQVRAHCPDVRILVMSAYVHDHYVFGVFSAGADGYILKDEAVEQVVSAVRVVAQAKTWLSPQVASKLVQHTIDPRRSKVVASNQLTKREMMVLRLMGQGQTNEEIATSLCITERTVRFHISNLLAKLGVSSRIEGIVQAIRLGLIQV
jgi:DNA-binding NarL/FixJ family response regulator